MKRPSNLVIGFILLIPSIFVFYAITRIAISLFKNPEVEIDDNSQVEIILEANANNYNRIKILKNR